MAKTAASGPDRRLLTFRVAGEHLALPASDVSEVIRPPVVTRVPLSPPGLRGVANLRGAVLPVISLGELLGSADVRPARNPRVIVIDRGAPIGLTVDEITALTSVADGEGDPESEADASGDPRTRARLIDIEGLLARTFGDLDRRARSQSALSESHRVEDGKEAREEIVLVSFEVAGQDYALPLERVSEIVALPAEMAVVPRTEEAMLGVTTVRGQLLPLVSLRALLGLRLNGSSQVKAKVLVARIDGTAIGLVADSMKEILRVPVDEIDAVPAVLTRGAGEAEIQGICRLDGGRRLVSILSTDRLLRDATRNGNLEGGNQKGSGMVADDTEAASSEQFVIFRLGGEEYGLPIAAVDEIVRVPETLTRLPTALNFVEGVMNLRGAVIPIIDQRQRFAFDRPRATRRERVVVVRIDHMQAGFVVDGVTEVLRVPVAQLRQAPELASDRSKVIDRIANIEIEGRMILLLDARELLDRAEKDLLAAMRLSESSRSGS